MNPCAKAPAGCAGPGDGHAGLHATMRGSRQTPRGVGGSERTAQTSAPKSVDVRRPLGGDMGLLVAIRADGPMAEPWTTTAGREDASRGPEPTVTGESDSTGCRTAFCGLVGSTAPAPKGRGLAVGTGEPSSCSERPPSTARASGTATTCGSPAPIVLESAEATTSTGDARSALVGMGVLITHAGAQTSGFVQPSTCEPMRSTPPPNSASALR
mmetsp:Transcript_15862/g.45805  ORF Transcript_15862/g.45805 Transcript_15862/m.45805 type:complete len:213 (-) Transcript_15862:428-1066(-)